MKQKRFAMEKKELNTFIRTQFIFVIKSKENADLDTFESLARLVLQKPEKVDVDHDLYSKMVLSGGCHFIGENVDPKTYEVGFYIEEEFSEDDKANLINNVIKPVILEHIKNHEGLTLDRSVFIDVFEQANITIIQ